MHNFKLQLYIGITCIIKMQLYSKLRNTAKARRNELGYSTNAIITSKWHGTRRKLFINISIMMSNLSFMYVSLKNLTLTTVRILSYNKEQSLYCTFVFCTVHISHEATDCSTQQNVNSYILQFQCSIYSLHILCITSTWTMKTYLPKKGKNYKLDYKKETNQFWNIIMWQLKLWYQQSHTEDRRIIQC
jgi:hypothetical protein